MKLLTHRFLHGLIGLLGLASLACSLQRVSVTTPATAVVLPLTGQNAVLEPVSPDPTPTTLPPPQSTVAGTPVPTVITLSSGNLTPFEEPEGCLRPPEDYTRITIGYAVLNRRTYWMLQRAQEIYGGTIPITGAGITQGSYNPGGVDASFGTHDGGGAVDISVRNIPYDWSIKWDDIPVLVNALRIAGFAAFYRDERDGLTPHIHAIAIGDQELSPVAAEQLTGHYGYFRGFDGYPRDDGIPRTPYYGNFTMCQWMLDMGYRDLRNEPLPPE